MWRGLLLLVLILAACTPVDDPLPTLSPLVATFTPRTSAWGAVETLTQTQQIGAPALLIHNRNRITTWTGADSIEARHIMQTPTTAAQILALKAYHPYQQQLFTADQNILMLWLDRTPETATSQVLAGLIAPNAVAEIGANVISTLPAQRYSAALADDNKVRIVWSGGSTAINNLYWQGVDFRARPLPTTLLRQEADYPALVHDQTQQWTLYWLEAESVYRGEIVDDALADVQLITRLRLAPTEAIETFTAAHDSTHAYLFWTIRDAEGNYRTLFTTGALDATEFTAPQALGIVINPAQERRTQYQSGTVYGASSSTTAATWATPLAGQHDTLPVALVIADDLGIAYFRDGAVWGYESVVSINGLIGAPALTTDNANHLYLAWSEPTTTRYATLYLTDTRP